MAASYEVWFQQPGVQVWSPSLALEIMEVGIRTKPSDVYVQIVVPLFNWQQPEKAAEILQPVAEGIERTLGRPEVQAIRWEQDITDSGLIVEWLVVTVQYQPPGVGTGPQTADVRVPADAFFGLGEVELVDKPIAATLASLQGIANL